MSDFTGEETKIVTVPPFAESVSEGDVRWEKGNQISHSDIIITTTDVNYYC
jgi:hypothetical protein